MNHGLVVLTLLALTPSPNPVDVDLNGDGKPDHVRLECEPGDSHYTLYVNDTNYAGRGENLEGTFTITDMDTSDAFNEVAIPQEGPSDDYATYFHSYDGRTISFMGTVPGTYELKFDGQGRIRTETRGHVLQTWFYPSVYVRRPTGSLAMVEQELYPMGTKCTMKVGLPLRASRSDSSVVTVLSPGDSIVIEASDDAEWCLVRASNGVWGWFRLARYGKIQPVGLLGFEVFDGLSYAD